MDILRAVPGLRVHHVNDEQRTGTIRGTTATGRVVVEWDGSNRYISEHPTWLCVIVVNGEVW
jgi:hypothetical protein